MPKWRQVGETSIGLSRRRFMFRKGDGVPTDDDATNVLEDLMEERDESSGEDSFPQLGTQQIALEADGASLDVYAEAVREKLPLHQTKVLRLQGSSTIAAGMLGGVAKGRCSVEFLRIGSQSQDLTCLLSGGDGYGCKAAVPLVELHLEGDWISMRDIALLRDAFRGMAGESTLKHLGRRGAANALSWLQHIEVLRIDRVPAIEGSLRTWTCLANLSKLRTVQLADTNVPWEWLAAVFRVASGLRELLLRHCTVELPQRGCEIPDIIKIDVSYLRSPVEPLIRALVPRSSESIEIRCEGFNVSDARRLQRFGSVILGDSVRLPFTSDSTCFAPRRRQGASPSMRHIDLNFVDTEAEGLFGTPVSRKRPRVDVAPIRCSILGSDQRRAVPGAITRFDWSGLGDRQRLKEILLHTLDRSRSSWDTVRSGDVAEVFYVWMRDDDMATNYLARVAVEELMLRFKSYKAAFLKRLDADDSLLNAAAPGDGCVSLASSKISLVGSPFELNALLTEAGGKSDSNQPLRRWISERVPIENVVRGIRHGLQGLRHFDPGSDFMVVVDPRGDPGLRDVLRVARKQLISLRDSPAKLIVAARDFATKGVNKSKKKITSPFQYYKDASERTVSLWRGLLFKMLMEQAGIGCSIHFRTSGPLCVAMPRSMDVRVGVPFGIIPEDMKVAFDITADELKDRGDDGGTPTDTVEVKNAASWFEIDSEVGAGKFGRVWAARHRCGGGKVAIKVIVLDAGLEGALSEMRVLNEYHHPCLSAAQRIFPGVVEWDNRITEGLVATMELCEGSLIDVMRCIHTGHGEAKPSLSQFWISISTRDRYVAMLCALIDTTRGMSYLHHPSHAPGESIIHRDLKMANVLVKVERTYRPLLRAVVADFGLAAIRPENLTMAADAYTPLTRETGTMGYMAPEQQRSCTYDRPADVYAFGVIVMSLLIGPVVDDDSGRILRKRDTWEEELESSPWPPLLPRLARLCLSMRALERPSFFDIYRLLLDEIEGVSESTKGDKEIFSGKDTN